MSGIKNTYPCFQIKCLYFSLMERSPEGVRNDDGQPRDEQKKSEQPSTKQNEKKEPKNVLSTPRLFNEKIQYILTLLVKHLMIVGVVFRK